MTEKNIVLIGMSGAGKSSVGRIVARNLNMEFIDIDNEIEKDEKMLISEIFECYGEEYFRKKEADIINRYSFKKGIVIATGGGVVLNNDNIINLKKSGIIFYIKRDINLILNTASKDIRPLFKKGDSYVIELFEKRKNLYENAAMFSVTNESDKWSAANEICKIYKEVNEK